MTSSSLPVHVPVPFASIFHKASAFCTSPIGASCASAEAYPIDALQTMGVSSCSQTLPNTTTTTPSAFWSTAEPTSRCDVVLEMSTMSMPSDGDARYAFISADDRSGGGGGAATAVAPRLAAISHLSIFYLGKSDKWVTPPIPGNEDYATVASNAVCTGSSSTMHGSVISITDMSAAATALVVDIGLSGGSRRFTAPDGTMYRQSEDGLVAQVLAKTPLSSIFDHKDKFSTSSSSSSANSAAASSSTGNRHQITPLTTETASGWLIRLGTPPQPSPLCTKYVLLRLQCVWEPQRPVGLSYAQLFPRCPFLDQLFYSTNATLQQLRSNKSSTSNNTTGVAAEAAAQSTLASVVTRQIEEREQQDALVAWASNLKGGGGGGGGFVGDTSSSSVASVPKSLSSYDQATDAHYFDDVFYSQRDPKVNKVSPSPLRSSALIRLSSSSSSSMSSSSLMLNNSHAKDQAAAAIASISAVIPPPPGGGGYRHGSHRLPSIDPTLQVRMSVVGQKRGRGGAGGGNPNLDDDATPPEDDIDVDGDVLTDVDDDDDVTPDENADNAITSSSIGVATTTPQHHHPHTTTATAAPQSVVNTAHPAFHQHPQQPSTTVIPAQPHQPSSPAPPAATPLPIPPTAATASTNPLTGVVFILSGYQNPQRAIVRDKAIALGAVFLNDWDPSKCTHLVCAVANTPKYQQVVQCSVRPHRVFIVDAKFIETAHATMAKPIEASFSVGVGALDAIY